jgi:hypothetical protein
MFCELIYLEIFEFFWSFWHGKFKFLMFLFWTFIFQNHRWIFVKIAHSIENFGENLFNVLVSIFKKKTLYMYTKKLTNTFNEIFLKRNLTKYTLFTKSCSMVNFIFRKYVGWAIKNYYLFSRKTSWKSCGKNDRGFRCWIRKEMIN